MITCEQCREELAEYALGRSDEGGAAAMVEHLAACVVCRRELAEIETAWAALPIGLEPRSPRPEVLERIERFIDETDGVRPKAAPIADNRIRLSPRQRVLSFALAASVLAALVGGVLYLERPGRGVAAVEPGVEEALRDLAQRLGKVQELDRMLNAGNVRLASLHAPNSAAAAGAYLIWDFATSQWHFFASRLPSAPAEKAYQLWAIVGDDAPLAGPTFAVDAAGFGSVVADFPQLDPGSRDVKAVVTLEPESGSTAPTSEALLEAQL